MKMRMDETTREEILSYVVRAQTRLGDAPGAEAVLNFFDQRGYRSRFYLRAFYIRLHKGDIPAAIDLLRQAREVRKYMGRVIGELAACYQRLGMITKEQSANLKRGATVIALAYNLLQRRWKKK